jgi:serine/threonine protein kinase
MLGQLVVTSGPDEGRVFTLEDGQTLVIGRGQASQTRLRDAKMSRIHCRVEIDGGKVLLSDAGSAAGTLVNGNRVERQRALQPGDVIAIGDTQLRFQLEATHEQSTLVEPSQHRRDAGATGATGGGQVRELLSDLVGKTLSHYELDQVIAEGNNGIVFRARDTEHDRSVALKILRPQISQNEEEMRRFVRAMKTVLPLKHSNLVELYNAGRTGRYCWIAMECIDGESLTKVIERIGIAGMLDWRYALRVAVHIGRALEFAAGHKIIHRNITPANILVRDFDKVAKLGDLMLAKALEGTLAEQITRPGQLVGEMAYMSPERTHSAAEVDGRSDIYSLGATVYALLTGRPPCEGGSLPETIKRIRDEEPAKPKQFQLSIPDAFEDVVLQMLGKRPDDRYQTPAELLTDLDRVAQFQGVEV